MVLTNSNGWQTNRKEFNEDCPDPALSCFVTKRKLWWNYTTIWIKTNNTNYFLAGSAAFWVTSWLIRHHHFIFLPRIKGFWKTNSQFPRDIHCTSSATCFHSGLKTGCGRRQNSNVYIKFDCCLEHSFNFVEFHRKIAWYCGQLIKLFMFRLIVKCLPRLVAIAFKGSFIILRKTFLQFSVHVTVAAGHSQTKPKK